MRPGTDERPVVTETGRVFSLYNKKLLDNMPPDIVAVMTYRELGKIEAEAATPSTTAITR
jgi:hypothetical protein